MRPKIKYRRLYILGSGFSKSISSEMPTIKDLSNIILNEKKEEYSDLVNFAKKFYEQTKSLKGYFNLEKLATIILSRNIFFAPSEKLFYQSLRLQLMKWIFNNIEKQMPEIDAEKAGILSHFLYNCSHNPLAKPNERSSLLISFNYDLLIERLLKKESEKKIMVDYIVQLNNYLKNYLPEEQAQETRMLEYLKLHGSFNWFIAPGSSNIDLNNVYRVEDDDPSKYLIHSEDLPVYIPMSYSRSQFISGSLYNVLWNIARQYLMSCDEIVFIGYGFPETDVDNLLLFLEFKHKIKDIVILESETSAKLHRINNLFKSCNVLNMDAYEYLKQIN